MSTNQYDMKENSFKELLTIEDVGKMIKMNTIDDCKQYLRILLDFYFDVIISPVCRNVTSQIEDDRNIWLQTIFSKACQFKSLLDGVEYSNGTEYLNPIIDFSVLFTIARNVYESLIAFEILFVIPRSEEQQTIIYNLFMAQGLCERLKNLDEDIQKRNPERIKSEQEDIDECKRAIEETVLYKKMNLQTKKVIGNAFGKKFRYIFKEDNIIERVDYDKSYALLNVKENLFNNIYSFFSLHGHPSFLSLIQFKDAFKNEYRADIYMAKHATQCILSFMSIFIIDYMKLNPNAKTLYDNLDEPRRFAIGMYEDAMRGENKFK